MEKNIDKETHEKAWREVKYGRRFLNAFRGLYVVKQTTRHLLVHIFSAVLVIFLGFYLKISGVEWILLIFAIGLVLVTEALNTAIEIDIDLTSPEYHPYARDTKDVAAGAVLLSAMVAIIIGLIIFLPKIMSW